MSSISTASAKIYQIQPTELRLDSQGHPIPNGATAAAMLAGAASEAPFPPLDVTVDKTRRRARSQSVGPRGKMTIVAGGLGGGGRGVAGALAPRDPDGVSPRAKHAVSSSMAAEAAGKNVVDIDNAVTCLAMVPFDPPAEEPAAATTAPHPPQAKEGPNPVVKSRLPLVPLHPNVTTMAAAHSLRDASRARFFGIGIPIKFVALSPPPPQSPPSYRPSPYRTDPPRPTPNEFCRAIIIAIAAAPDRTIRALTASNARLEQRAASRSKSRGMDSRSSSRHRHHHDHNHHCHHHHHHHLHRRHTHHDAESNVAVRSHSSHGHWEKDQESSDNIDNNNGNGNRIDKSDEKYSEEGDRHTIAS